MILDRLGWLNKFTDNTGSVRFKPRRRGVRFATPIEQFLTTKTKKGATSAPLHFTFKLF